MDMAADRERRGQPGDGFPVGGTDSSGEGQQHRDGFGAEPRTALDETTPADRAGWEAALDAAATVAGGVPGDRATDDSSAEPGHEAAPPAVVPEYEEDHPIAPPAGQDDITVGELRGTGGESIPERERRRQEASG